jgi:hypothetical protein
METSTIQTAPVGSNGYGEKAQTMSLTESMKAVTGAMGLADTAGKTVLQAVEQTRGVNVPGMNVGDYIVAALAPALAKIGREIVAIEDGTQPQVTHRKRGPNKPKTDDKK